MQTSKRGQCKYDNCNCDGPSTESDANATQCNGCPHALYMHKVAANHPMAINMFLNEAPSDAFNSPRPMQISNSSQFNSNGSLSVQLPVLVHTPIKPKDMLVTLHRFPSQHQFSPYPQVNAIQNIQQQNFNNNVVPRRQTYQGQSSLQPQMNGFVQRQVKSSVQPHYPSLHDQTPHNYQPKSFQQPIQPNPHHNQPILHPQPLQLQQLRAQQQQHMSQQPVQFINQPQRQTPQQMQMQNYQLPNHMSFATLQAQFERNKSSGSTQPEDTLISPTYSFIDPEPSLVPEVVVPNEDYKAAHHASVVAIYQPRKERQMIMQKFPLLLKNSSSFFVSYLRFLKIPIASWTMAFMTTNALQIRDTVKLIAWLKTRNFTKQEYLNQCLYTFQSLFRQMDIEPYSSQEKLDIRAAFPYIFAPAARKRNMSFKNRNATALSLEEFFKIDAIRGSFCEYCHYIGVYDFTMLTAHMQNIRQVGRISAWFKARKMDLRTILLQIALFQQVFQRLGWQVLSEMEVHEMKGGMSEENME